MKWTYRTDISMESGDTICPPPNFKLHGHNETAEIFDLTWKTRRILLYALPLLSGIILPIT